MMYKYREECPLSSNAMLVLEMIAVDDMEIASANQLSIAEQMTKLGLLIRTGNEVYRLSHRGRQALSDWIQITD